MLGDGEYMYAFERLAWPIIKQFDPEMVFVSAGFDSCRGDPLGDIDVTQDTYCHITTRLMSLAQGKVVVALEGGYNFKSISLAAESVLRVLIGETMPTKCSETGFSQEKYLKTVLPSVLQFEDLKIVQEEWQKHWPILAQDESLFELQEQIKKRLNQPHWIRGTSNRDKIKLETSGDFTGSFVKEEIDQSIINVYQAISQNDQISENFPKIQKIEGNKVYLKNWTNETSGYYSYIKLNPYRRKSDEEEPVHLAGGIFIDKSEKNRAKQLRF